MISEMASLSLCHCAFEAELDDVDKMVVDVFTTGKSFLSYCLPHTAHDCATVLYVIGKMQECSGMSIDFSNSGIRESQIQKLKDTLAVKRRHLQVKTLNLHMATD